MSEEQYKNFAKLLQSTVSNLSQSFYDSYVAKSVQFARRAGYNTTVTRRVLTKCCDWCSDMAGTYEYGEHPADIFKRHANCRCLVTYNEKKDGSKGYTDVWSKKEFNTQKEARLAREEELSTELNNEKITTTTNKHLKQDTKVVQIPKNEENNFADYGQLELPEAEKNTIKELNTLSKNDEYEHIAYIYSNGDVKKKNSKLRDKVIFENELVDKNGTKVYHSHTNVTPPSRKDLEIMCIDGIDEMGVVAINGDTYIVSLGSGWRPTKEEYIDRVIELSQEIDQYIAEQSEKMGWTAAESNYMAIKETFFRITREFKWNVKGGNIFE